MQTIEENNNNDLNLWDIPTKNGSEPVVDAPVQSAEPPPPVGNPTTGTEGVITEQPPSNNTEPVTPSIEPTIVEKIVEKVVEKQPEFKDDFSRLIYEALSTGDQTSIDTVYDYISTQKRDYQTMADIDVIKAGLKHTNPKWTDKDLDIEIRTKYGHIPTKIDLNDIDMEADPEKYDQAEKHNEMVEQKELLLSRDARDFRYALEDAKKKIELPKLKTEPQNPTPAQPTPEQLAEYTQKWEAAVDSELPKLSDIKVKIGDEEVTYKATDEEKKEFTALMKGFDDVTYLTNRGWYDKEGNINVLKVAEDVRKLERFDKIIASVGTQLKTAAKKDVIAEIKNIDVQPGVTVPELGVDLADKIWS